MTRNLLFVDHEPQLHTLYRDLFRSRPEFKVYTVRDAETATNVLRRVPLELIVVDIPSLGFAAQGFLRFAKHATERAKRRVILLGGQYAKECARQYDTDMTGALDALAKPFGARDLVSLIDRVLPGPMKIEIPEGF